MNNNKTNSKQDKKFKPKKLSNPAIDPAIFKMVDGKLVKRDK
jgi:hypothetical protein